LDGHFVLIEKVSLRINVEDIGENRGRTFTVIFAKNGSSFVYTVLGNQPSGTFRYEEDSSSNNNRGD